LRNVWLFPDDNAVNERVIRDSDGASGARDAPPGVAPAAAQGLATRVRLRYAETRDFLLRKWRQRPHGTIERAPADPIVVGIELHIPIWWRLLHRFRLTALDPHVGRRPEIGAYVDVSFRVTPGATQTFEFVLTVPPAADAQVEILVEVDAGAAAWTGLLATALARLARRRVRRVWLRSNRLTARDVTIIVLNWNRPRETIACLESLAAAELDGATVLVVDNGSPSEAVAMIRERFPDQRVLCLPENRGYAGGNNAGIRDALERGAKAVMILNNDTRVAADFLAPLLWVLNADIKAAATASAVLRTDYDNMLESAYLEIYWGHGIIKHYGVNALPGEGFHFRREVDVTVGTSVLFSADALREIGPLDESYFAYHEEVEWCFRARRAGYRVYWQPFSRVWHNKSTSTAELGAAPSGERARATGEQLAAPMALTWNPVQTYLGARNGVRFIRQHASLPRKIYFLLSSLYAVPLEFLAAVMRQESALKIGAWNYRRAFALYWANPDGVDDPPPASALSRLRRVPVTLFRTLPRDVRQARAEGRLAQVAEHVHGLWDGVRDRPLPLERLGLR
jgi:GT2 family glycosyltransferase